MPYIIKALAGGRRDPLHRPKKGGRHLSPAIRRAYSRLTIGNRTIKRGKSVSVSDAVYEQFKAKIDALAITGVISLRKTGDAKDGWQPEQLHAPAPLPPEPPAAPAAPEVVEEKVERGVVEIEMSPERAHDEDGHFSTDDPATPEVNEAWEGGKAPEKAEAAPKKRRARRKKKDD